jgi:hypothetical protein
MMMMMRVFALFLSSAAMASAMTANRMAELIQEQDPDAELPGSGGHRLQFSHKEQSIELIYDVYANRMRLIAPIKSTADLQEEEMEKMLEANFHTSLDVRYATSGGAVYAAYLHPLSSLEEEQFLGAIDQVATAASTFGTAYSAGSLTFVGSSSVAGTTITTTTTTKPKKTASLRTEVERKVKAEEPSN